MYVALGTTAPFIAAGDELEFNDAFCAIERCDGAVEILRGERHEDADTFLEGFEDFRLADDLWKVWRADFFLAFRNENKIHRNFFAGAANRVECGEEGCFRAFLVDGTATDQDFSDALAIHDGRIEWRRGPFLRVELLYVIHEIEANGFGSARVECGENAGVAVGRHLLDHAEAGLLEHVHHELAAFVHVAVFGGDAWKLDPVLEALDGFVVMLIDFGAYRSEVVRSHPFR